MTAEDAQRLERCLADGGVAIIPTDTVYGIACDPASAGAMSRIYELKQRPPAKPAAVMFFSLDAALGVLAELGPRTRGALTALLPGPVTLLLANPQHRFPLACDPAGEEKMAPLGLRVPCLEGALAALGDVCAPVLQSSANFSGEPPARRLTDVPAEVREGADLVLDGGELPGLASTVIDLCDYDQSGNWQIVRDGPLSRTAVERLLG